MLVSERVVDAYKQTLTCHPYWECLWSHLLPKGSKRHFCRKTPKHVPVTLKGDHPFSRFMCPSVNWHYLGHRHFFAYSRNVATWKPSGNKKAITKETQQIQKKDSVLSFCSYTFNSILVGKNSATFRHHEKSWFSESLFHITMEIPNILHNCRYIS